jgi:hypothetical protein
MTRWVERRWDPRDLGDGNWILPERPAEQQQSVTGDTTQEIAANKLTLDWGTDPEAAVVPPDTQGTKDKFNKDKNIDGPLGGKASRHPRHPKHVKKGGQKGKSGRRKYEKRRRLRLGTWNVQGLGSALKKENLDADASREGLYLIGLQETKHQGDSLLEWIGQSHVLWMFPQRDTPGKVGGVGFAVHKSWIATVIGLQQVNDRIAVLLRMNGAQREVDVVAYMRQQTRDVRRIPSFGRNSMHRLKRS